MANGFRDRLQGLLSGADPLGNLGLGLLAASGPSPVKQSLGQILGQGVQFASGRQQAAMQNEAARQAMLQRQRQQQAQEKLSGLLSGGTEGADQQQLLGLLAQASPDAFNQALTQGLLGQMMPQEDRAEPGFIRELRAAGIDPASPEGRELVVNRARGQGASDALLQQIQLQLQAFQLEDARRRREEEEENEAQARRSLVVETQSTISKAQELAELNDALESTALATGQPFAEVYRGVLAGGAPILERFGVDTTEARQAVADFDRFNKLATDFGIGLIDRLKNTGAITDTKFQALQKTMAGIGTSPGANRLVMADVLQTALDGADVEEIPIADREEIEAMIKRLKASEPRGPVPPVVDIPAAASRVGAVLDFNDLPDE